jgi:hypothetical protein
MGSRPFDSGATRPSRWKRRVLWDQPGHVSHSCGGRACGALMVVRSAGATIASQLFATWQTLSPASAASRSLMLRPPAKACQDTKRPHPCTPARGTGPTRGGHTGTPWAWRARPAPTPGSASGAGGRPGRDARRHRGPARVLHRWTPGCPRQPVRLGPTVGIPPGPGGDRGRSDRPAGDGHVTSPMSSVEVWTSPGHSPLIPSSRPAGSSTSSTKSRRRGAEKEAPASIDRLKTRPERFVQAI